MKRAHNSQKYWRLKGNLKCLFIFTFSSVWLKFRSWATTFCHLISKGLPVSFCLHKLPQCKHTVSRCLQWRIFLYFWMRPLLVTMLYLWVNIPVSARDSGVSPEHDEDGVSLLRCVTLAIQVQVTSTQKQSNWPPPQSEDDPWRDTFSW